MVPIKCQKEIGEAADILFGALCPIVRLNDVELASGILNQVDRLFPILTSGIGTLRVRSHRISSGAKQKRGRFGDLHLAGRDLAVRLLWAVSVFQPAEDVSIPLQI
ncbi:hypothetical protein D1012_21605 [Pseudotabrizicola alkalilacus]|uniref:Uncharacterized protein n=1 Tax=Pseudotabrizicola alkalilacus TaxID=2305252 RepID=A0A411YWK4_9RHOB|nr:hypothetical protein D1012_21605 [Pseudotabrizicola alkalilacus]